MYFVEGQFPMLSIRLFLIVLALTESQQSETAAVAGHNHTDESTSAWRDVNHSVVEQLNSVTSRWSYWTKNLSDKEISPSYRFFLSCPAPFYPRDAILARSLRQRVRPSVCHAGIVPTRAKAGSWNVHLLIARDSSFVEKFAMGHPKGTCQMRVG